MTSWESVRAVADAVLYEGYLLYPYRASSDRNRSRWQFGVLGPPGAAAAGFGEDDTLSAQFLVRPGGTLNLVVRFLHLQHRRAEQRTSGGGYRPVTELVTPAGSWLTWDEAVEAQFTFGPWEIRSGTAKTAPIVAPARTDVEELPDGRLVREQAPLTAEVTMRVEAVGPVDRITLSVTNTGDPATGKQDAVARSLLGTHLIAGTDSAFVSLLEPPAELATAAADCNQHRCFPVLAGPSGTTDLLLISPIILYDHPQVAEQSRGALFDATEIDEILTLRVMTMTDEEKSAARATDPAAARIIDQCDGMSAESMASLHGTLRDPYPPAPGLIPEIPDGVDWWDPMADSAVAPEADAVLVGGIRVARGSRVRLHPGRHADAQDMFVAGRTACVSSVHQDVDGGVHLGVVLDDDPAADLHAAYGRYLYFSPDEVEPLQPGAAVSAEPEERSPTWR